MGQHVRRMPRVLHRSIRAGVPTGVTVMDRQGCEREIIKGLDGARFGTIAELMKVFGYKDRASFKASIIGDVEPVPGTHRYCVKDIVDAIYKRP